MSTRLDRVYVDPNVPVDRFAKPPELAQLHPFVDIVLEQPKSVSIYYAALRVEHRPEEAELVLQQHELGVDEAVRYLHREAAWGHIEGQYLGSTGLVVAQLEHVAAQDHPKTPPHIHTHLLVEPYVIVRLDQRIGGPGLWQTVDEHLAEALALEPLATPERRQEIRIDVTERGRKLGQAYSPTPDGGQWVDLDRPTLLSEAGAAEAIYALAVDQRLRNTFPQLRITAPAPGRRPEIPTIDADLHQIYAGRECRPGPVRQLDWPPEPEPLAEQA